MEEWLHNPLKCFLKQMEGQLLRKHDRETFFLKSLYESGWEFNPVLIIQL